MACIIFDIILRFDKNRTEGPIPLRYCLWELNVSYVCTADRPPLSCLVHRADAEQEKFAGGELDPVATSHNTPSVTEMRRAAPRQIAAPAVRRGAA